MGRKKLERKKIENIHDRRVCFSKRRDGIIKKASRLSKLFGINTIFLTYSSAGRPFLYSTLPSSSSVDSIFEKIINDYQQSQIATNASSVSSPNLQSQSEVENYTPDCSSVDLLSMDFDDTSSLSSSQLESYKHILEELNSEVSSADEDKALVPSQGIEEGGSSSVSMETGLPMMINEDTTTEQVFTGDNKIESTEVLFTDEKFNIDAANDQTSEGDNRILSTDGQFFAEANVQGFQGENEINQTYEGDYDIVLTDDAYKSDNEFDLELFVKDLLNTDAPDQIYEGGYENDQMINTYTNYQVGHVGFNGILSVGN